MLFVEEKNQPEWKSMLNDGKEEACTHEVDI